MRSGGGQVRTGQPASDATIQSGWGTRHWTWPQSFEGPNWRQQTSPAAQSLAVLQGGQLPLGQATQGPPWSQAKRNPEIRTMAAKRMAQTAYQVCPRPRGNS